MAPGQTGAPNDAMKYRAFISYKHIASTGFAENLELAIKAYAKPIWRPPMKVFRDEKYLRPGVNLPGLIRDSLDQSEYLIYLASPEAARSSWVQDELLDWCAHEHRLKRLIVVLTDGRIVPDPDSKKINWAQTDALPESLAGKLVYIPFYVDLSWAERAEQQSLLNPDYKKAINLIVATLRDIDPIELTGVEVLQHRRNVRVRNAFIASIAALSVGITGVALFAWQQMRKAEWRATYSEALRIADASPNLAASVLRDLPANADVEAAPLAWRLINRTPVWTSAEFRGHGDSIWSLAFDTTGTRLATGSGDGTVRIRSVDGSASPVVLRGHGALVLDIDFSTDGQRIATVAEDDAIRVFDSKSGELLREIAVVDSQVNHVAFKPSGSDLMAASYRELKIHDAGGSAATIARTTRLIEAAWSPDGKTLVAVSADEEVGARLYHRSSGDSEALPGSDEEGAYAASFSPDGSLIAVICLDGVLRLYSTADVTDQQVMRPDVDDTQAPVVRTADRLVAFSADGGYVAAAFGRRLKVWSLAADRPGTLDHESAVNDFDIGPDGQSLVTLDGAGVVRFWSAREGSDYVPVVLPGHADVNRVALTKDGFSVVTAAGDGSVRLWSVDSSPRAESVLRGHEGAVRHVAFSPDGETLASASDDRSTRLWRVDDSSEIVSLTTQPASETRSVTFSPDGQSIAVAGEEGVFVWPSSGVTGEPRRLHEGTATAVAYHPGGDWLIVTTGRGEGAAVHVYPVRGTGSPRTFAGEASLSTLAPLGPAAQHVITFIPREQLATLYRFDGTAEPLTLRGHGELLHDASFSPDGRFVVTGSSDWSARVWEVSTGLELRRLEGSGTEVELARFSPDSRHIVTMSSEHMIRLWDLDGRMLRKVQAGGAPGEVAFSADGKKLLIVENGFQGHHLVRVIEVDSDGDPILLTGHAGRIHHAAFSPDGSRVATAGDDGTVRVYPVDWPTLRQTLIRRSPTLYTD